MALRAFDGVIDEDHTVAVVTVISPWTHLTGGLTLVLLEPTTRTDHGGSRVLGAVVTHTAEARVVCHLSLGAVIPSTAVPYRTKGLLHYMLLRSNHEDITNVYKSVSDYKNTIQIVIPEVTVKLCSAQYSPKSQGRQWEAMVFPWVGL